MPLTDRLAVCSWSLLPESGADLVEKLHATGQRRTQLHLNPIATNQPGWTDALDRLQDADIEVVSGMVTCVGEDYSSIAAIERTGGVVPDETWPQTREQMAAAAPVAEALGLSLVTFHAGFIPHDAASPIRGKVADRLREAADLFGNAGCAIALETGQESADALQALLEDVLRRDDIGVNFDPANMILYGSGDPIAALRQLRPHVKQVHLKDATPSAQPGVAWGEEVAVGNGAVDWPAFFEALGSFDGDLCIEREAGTDRVADIRTAARHVSGLA